MSPAKADVLYSLITQNDISAGLINAIYANGESVVQAENLVDASLNTTYASNDGRLRNLTRDVLKMCVQPDGYLECFFGFELQSEPEPFMPVRVAGYNGATYRDQLDNESLKKRYNIGVSRVAPVFTTVLHFGVDQWRANLKLSDRATMSDRMARVMAPHFDDYQIKVVDFAGMTDDELLVFPNEIQIIARYFRAKRRKIEFVIPELKIVHVRQMCDFMTYVANDDRYDYNNIMEGYEKEPENMCEIIDRAVNARISKRLADERQEGRKEGREEGRAETQKEMAVKQLEKQKTMAAKLRKKGWSDEEIADFLDVEVVDVRIWLDSAGA